MELITEKYTRICPGSHIAISTIWIAAASILATFNLSKSVDKDGKVIEPSCEYLSAIIRWFKAQSVISTRDLIIIIKTVIRCLLSALSSHALMQLRGSFDLLWILTERFRQWEGHRDLDDGSNNCGPLLEFSFVVPFKYSHPSFVSSSHSSFL